MSSTLANSMLVCALASNNASVTAPSGMTLRGGPADTKTNMAELDLPSAGATGTKTWGHAGSVTTCAAFSVILQPPAVTEVDVAGAQPAATGEIAALSYKSLAGAQPAATGSIAAKTANKQLAGSQPAGSGTLTLRRLLSHIALAGNQPAASGEIAALSYKALAGNQPAGAGALSIARLIALAGSQGQPKGGLSAMFKGLAAAVAFDAESESHTSTTPSTSEASFSWTHTPVGAAKGVLVFVWTNANSGLISSVTYGGVTVPAVSGGQAADTTTEPGRSNAFFLGSGVPQGAQTVQVNRTNNATAMYAVAITVTCIGDTEVYTPGIVLVENNGTVAQQSVTDGSPGANSVRFAGGHFGHQTLPAAGANSTAVHSIDIGDTGFVVVRETTAGQGSRSVGMSSGTSDDRAIVHLAVRGKQTKVWLQGEQPAGTGEIAGEVGAITEVALAGNQPSATGRVRVSALQVRGNQPSPAGALVAAWVNKLVAGVQPAGAGALTALQSLARTLEGAQAAPSGALAVKYLIAVVGAQPGGSGTLVGLFANKLVSGLQPASSGDVVARQFEVVEGEQPAATGEVVVLQNVAVVGEQPAGSGVLVGLVVAKLLTGSQGDPAGEVVALQLNVGFGPLSGRAKVEDRVSVGRAKVNVQLGVGRGRFRP